MDYPLRYLLEKLLKKYLKTYFETDKLNLNSLSLLNSSINLNNLILKTSEINTMDLPFTLLSAQISELIIAASLFQNKFNILANGIDINLFLPSNKLDRFIFKQKEILVVNKEFIDSFLPEKHNLNKVFEVLKTLFSYDFELKEIRINLYVELFGFLFNFSLLIPEILSSSNKEDFSITRINKVNGSSLRLNTVRIQDENYDSNTTYEEKTLTWDEITKIMRTIEKNSNWLLEEFSFEVTVQANDFRFYKPETNVMEKLRSNKFKEFNSSNSNNKININVNKIKLVYSQNAIMNILLFCKCFERFSSIRKEKRQTAINNFRNFVYNYHHLNRDKKHISWVNEKRLYKVNKNENGVRLIFYIFLVMIKKQYVKYNISKYLMIELIRNYRKSIGKEYSIIDYLIDSNIDVFLNAPTINSIGGMFMSINEIEKYINRADNKKLREFIFFILKEYTIIKSNIEMYNRYDDYFCVSLKVNMIDIFLEKSNEVTFSNSTTIKDDMWEIVYYKYNKLESKNNDQVPFDFTNTLLKVELRNIEMKFITDVKDNMVLEVSLESLNIFDIGYKTINTEKSREKKYMNEKHYNSLPLLNIQYKFTLSLEKFENDMSLIIEIPKVFICLDPITLYLIKIYFQNIFRRLESQKIKTIEETFANVTQANKKDIGFLFKKVKIYVIKLIINLNKTNFTDSSDKSLLLKFNLIDFLYERENDRIIFDLKEIACGSIDTHQIIELLNSRKIIIYFNSTIINLFNVSLNISIKDRSVKIPLPKAFLEFKKQDLACVMNYIHMIKTAVIFDEYLINNNDYWKQSKDEENDTIKENLSLYFLDISVEKLYFKFHLEIDSKFNEQNTEQPSYILVFVESPKLIISSTDYRFNIVFNLKNLGIARGCSVHSNRRLNDSFNSGNNKILYIQCENVMDISSIYGLQDFLEQDRENNLFLIQFVTRLNINQILVRIPPLHCYFDHELLSFLLNFFNSLRKTNLEKEAFLKQLLVKTDYIRIRKQSRISENLKEQSKINSIRQTEIKVKIKETFIEIIYKKELFLSAKLSDIDINYKSKVNELNAIMIINSISDERLISSNNKNILFGDFKLDILLTENILKIKFFKPKITFLKRILMDLVEYFYYTLILEVLAFNNVNPVKEDIKDNTHIMSNRNTIIKMKKIAKSAKNQSSYNASICKEEKVKPFAFSLVIENGDILLSLNSLKSKKLFFSFESLEFSILSPSLQLTFFNLLRKKFEEIYKEKFNGSEESLRFLVTAKNPVIYNFVGINSKDPEKFKENCIARFPECEENLSNLSVIIEMKTENNFSYNKLYVLIPKLKLRLFTDTYEYLLRLFMENIFEGNTVRCKVSEENLLRDPKSIRSVYPFFQMWILSQDIKASIYTFPSECLLHKVSKDYDKCSFKIHNKTAENRSIEKFCILKLSKFTYYMGYLSNYLSTSSVSAFELNCILNKKFSLFTHYSNLDLIKRTNESQITSNKKKMLKIKINKHFDRISDFKITLDQIHLNFVVHAILTLKNFFSRYFLYYSNKNIKYVYLGESQKKRVVVNMKNSNLILRNTLLNTSDTIYELEINLGLSFVLCNQGNTWIGPFKDSKKIQIYIKKMLLNNVRPAKGKTEVKLSNKILSDFSFLVELNCESNEREQKEGRVYYIYLSKCPKEDVEMLYSSKNKERKLKNRNPLINFYNTTQQIYEVPQIIVNIRNVEDYRNEIYSLKFYEEEIIYNKKEKGNLYLNVDSQADDSDDETIRTSLIQILQIQMIIKNFNECYAKYISDPLISHINNFTTSFSEIKYDCYYGINFENIEIILNDSQFNSKLFKCSLSKVAFFITNTPDERDSLIIPDAMKNYEHFYVMTNSNVNPKNEIDQSKSMFHRISKPRVSTMKNYNFIDEIDKDSFIVMNDKKMIPNFNYFILSKSLISIYFQNNNFLKWEPFIEPLPIILNYFSNKNHQFINISLSSLEKLDYGIENISRQKNFHSLNINMSESLIENLKAFKNDYDKSQLQNYYLRNTELDKKIVIINFTDCKYQIRNIDNFTEDKESNYTKILRYQTKKSFENKEEILLEFKNEQKKGNKQVTIVNNNHERIREEEHFEDPLHKEKKVEGKGNFSLNIEKTSKFYFLIKVDNNNSLKQIDDHFLDEKSNPDLHEILKSFDESILLEGEQIMITDVILNMDKNQKTVFLRSNFGIRNELDFKVKLKYILKDEEYLHSNKLIKERIILAPNHIFYIPSTVLNKILKIKIKPFFNKDFIKTSYGEFFINPNNYKNKINIVNCEFKYTAEEKEEDKYSPFRNPIFDFMNFAVYMKKNFAENDCLHMNIRKRLDSIRLYSKFKGKENQGTNKKNLENNLCDYTFILSPLIKFMNALPRSILIKKRLKNELMKVVNIIPKNVNKKEKEIDKFFDIDFFIKLYSNETNNENSNAEEKKNQAEEIEENGIQRFKDKFTLESKELPETKNEDLISQIITKLRGDVSKKTLKEGDYISIYEGFYLNENYVENLEYVITIDKLEKNSKSILNGRDVFDNIEQKSEEDNENRYFEAIFEPFNIDIIKNLASAKYEQSKLTYKLNNIQNKKIENIVKKIPNNKNKKENLLYSVGFNDKYSLDLYIFCPYLFLNSSDLDLKLLYNNTEYNSELNKEVINNLRSSPENVGVGSTNKKEEILINENDSRSNKNFKQGLPQDKLNSPEISY